LKNKITKIPPLSGGVQAQLDAIRRHVNTMVDDVEKALEAKDREIAELKRRLEEKRDG
jgi:phosphate uptake regulator